MLGKGLLGQASSSIAMCNACQAKRRFQVLVTYWKLWAGVFTQNGGYLAYLRDLNSFVRRN
jgi:hypothetical protein